MTSPEPGPQAGFSLLEVLVAMALLTLVIGMVGTTINIVMLSVDRGVSDINRVDMMSRAHSALRTDIMRLQRIVEAETKGAGSAQYRFVGRKRELAFVVSEPDYPTDAGSYVITYRFHSVGDGGELVRSRDLFEPAQAHRRRRARKDRSADVTVLEGAYTVTFEYLAVRGRQLRWVSKWIDDRALPRLIKVNIAPTKAGGFVSSSLIVRPRVTAEASCVDPKGRFCAARRGGRIAGTRWHRPKRRGAKN